MFVSKIYVTVGKTEQLIESSVTASRLVIGYRYSQIRVPKKVRKPCKEDELVVNMIIVLEKFDLWDDGIALCGKSRSDFSLHIIE